MKNIFNKISQYGIQDERDEFIKQKIVLANKLSLILAFFFLIIGGLLSVKFQLFASSALLLLLVLILVSIPFINKIKHSSFARVLLSLVLPVFIYAASIYAKLYSEVGKEIVFYFLPRTAIVIITIIPLLVLDFRKKLQYYLPLVFYAFCILMYSRVHDMLDIGIYKDILSVDSYFLASVIPVLILIVLVFVFSLMQKLNYKYELSLQQKNIELIESEEKQRIAKEKSEENTKKFKNLFENNPVSLWEEDYSGIMALLESLRSLKISNYKEYLLGNRHIVKECSQKIKILDVNEATLTMLKAPSKEYLFNNIEKILNKKSNDFFIDELEALLLNKKEFFGETELVRFDGKIITVISKMFITEKAGRIVTAATDITKRKLSEKELIVAKEKAEESDCLKTEFLKNMSHEVRTPLNGILGFSKLLGMGPDLSEKEKYFTDVIQDSGYQLLGIIDNILEMSQLTTKQVKVQNNEVCLNYLLVELFSIFDVKAKENKTPLYLQKILPDEECKIYTDKTKLTKILSNLLENALKFTNSGFIEFGYSLVETYGRTSLHEKNIQIYVKDTGIGIDSGKQEKIFERFSQVEKKVSQNVGGLGLGLSIAKEYVDLLGGNIRLESEKGKGSTFFVTIPYKQYSPKEEKQIITVK